MAQKLTVQTGNTELQLIKSQRFVGLRTNTDTDLTEQPQVERRHHPQLGGFEVVTLNGRSVDDQLDELRQHDDVEVGTHVYHPVGSHKAVVPTGELIITFASGTNEEEQQIVLDEYALELVDRRDDRRLIARVTDRSPNPIKVAAALKGISLVAHAEPDMDMLLDEYDFAAPSDTLFNQQWHLKNEGIVPDVNYRLKRSADAKVVDAWQRLGSDGTDKVTIAVIDNGFDTTHPDLASKIVHPIDLWTGSSIIPQGNVDFTHGTPCASVALAARNGNGIVGAAPNAKFMPVSGTSFSLRNTEKMFKYCVERGADIISCSWGTTDPRFSLNTLKEEAISYAVRKGRGGKGCIVLFAVGNDDLDYVSYYAQHPEVIAVGATTSRDEHASYSNRGREIDLVAPSNGDWPIIAARAWWDEGTSLRGPGIFRYYADGFDRGDGYKHFGGTSSATPLVAGICALMLDANPDLTAIEVKEILQNTADKIGRTLDYDSKGHSLKYGYGRVNADRAVAEALRRKEGSNPVKEEVTPAVSTGRGLFEFTVEKRQPRGWGVQTGVFAEYGNVLIEAEKLQRQFSAPVLVSINELDGRTVYKVVLGQYVTKQEGERLLSEMRAKGRNGWLRTLEGLA